MCKGVPTELVLGYVIYYVHIMYPYTCKCGESCKAACNEMQRTHKGIRLRSKDCFSLNSSAGWAGRRNAKRSANSIAIVPLTRLP